MIVCITTTSFSIVFEVFTLNIVLLTPQENEAHGTSGSFILRSGDLIWLDVHNYLHYNDNIFHSLYSLVSSYLALTLGFLFFPFFVRVKKKKHVIQQQRSRPNRGICVTLLFFFNIEIYLKTIFHLCNYLFAFLVFILIFIVFLVLDLSVFVHIYSLH